MCYFPTLPQFIKDLGGQESAVGFLIGVSSLTALTTRPFVGYLVDRIGRKPLLVTGMFVFCFNALLYNLPTVPEAVFPVRLVTGFGFAIFLTASSTYIADVAPAEKRGSILAYFGIASTLAFASGPTMGSFIIESNFFNGFEDFFTSRASWLAGAHTGDDNFTSLFIITAGIAFFAGICALFLPEPEREKGLVPRFSFKNVVARAAVFPAGINFTSTFVMSGMVTLLPIFAKDEIGMANVGLFFAVYAAGVIGARILLGPFMDRVPRVFIVAPGIAALILSMLILSANTTVAGMYVIAIVYGLGAGAFQPALMAYTVDVAPALERGRAMSTFTLGADLGLSLGAFTLGVVAQTAGYRAAFILAAFVAAGGLLAFIAGWRRRPIAAAIDAAAIPSPTGGLPGKR